jgi:hypothetical protein
MSHKAFAPPLSHARAFEVKQIQEKTECDEKPRRGLVKLIMSVFE